MGDSKALAMSIHPDIVRNIHEQGAMRRWCEERGIPYSHKRTRKLALAEVGAAKKADEAKAEREARAKQAALEDLPVEEWSGRELLEWERSQRRRPYFTEEDHARWAAEEAARALAEAEADDDDD